VVEKRIYTPTELTRQIKSILSDSFYDIWVEGEISNLRIPTSAHAYFTLKDERSQLRVVMFKSRRRFLRFELEDGLRVLIRGSIDVYEPRGEYQLIAELVQPKGAGALELAFKQLKERLEREGLFSPDHKKPLPFLPRCIGVITSPTGAAVRDLLKTLNYRFSNLEILIHPVKVQGQGAASEIAAAIKEMNRKKWSVDLLIVTRGGGSIEDLWCFNEEPVARAIFESNIPVISAVGHEIDFTIADFVADVRAPTPTAAGEIAVPHKEELISFINSLTDRLARGMQYQLEGLKHRLAISQMFRIFLEPERIIRDKRQQLDDFQIRLGEALKYRPEREKVSHLTSLLHIRSPKVKIASYSSILREKRQRLGIAARGYLKNSNLNFKGLVGRLDSLSPLAVLGRGYAVCYHLPDRKVVTDVGNIKLDDQVEIQVEKGEMVCGVLEITHPQEEPTEKNN
jgi:exodeoxyribonuclease VII large subunit